MIELRVKPKAIQMRLHSPVEQTLAVTQRRVFLRMANKTVVNQVGVNYVHNQQVASIHWIINHNLNTYPSVSIIDSGGNVNLAQYEYISANRVDVFFSALTSGNAYLN
jgi:hypothetical protein